MRFPFSFGRLGPKVSFRDQLLVLALMVTALLGFFGSVSMAFGEGLPQSTLPDFSVAEQDAIAKGGKLRSFSAIGIGLPQSTLPACDCAPCTCPPGTCTCPDCAVGCKKGGAASVADATYSVGYSGIVSPVDPVTPQPMGQTYHTEYRQVCNGRTCSMVAVSVPDAPGIINTPAQPYQPKYGAGSTCPCCGMTMTAEQAAKMNATAPTASATPMYATTMTGYTSYSSGDGSDDSGSASGRTFRTPIRSILFRGRGARKGGCGGG